MIRTLIVEDDALVAEVHASYVERVEGFALAGVAHRATEALELLDERPVDLVLLDFHLPDAQGLELLRVLRARSGAQAIDVIAVTAARDPDSIRRAIAGGVVQYLVKPFPFSALQDKLERYARYRRQVEGAGQADQAQVDQMLGTLRGGGAAPLPKGLNATTLDHVRGVLRDAGEPLTAADAGGRCGLSRVTARRYLEHLVVEGAAELSMRYGGTGRPEHLYTSAAP